MQLGYDSGDLVSITDPLNRTVTRYVDGAGRVTRTTNALGHTTRVDFDAVNQPTQGTDASGATAAMSFDPNGNILSMTDARNGVTRFVYDDMDRVSTARDPLLHDDVYEYDANGNLSQFTDRTNQITTFTYDALDRLTQVTYADTSSTVFTYDSVNRVTQISDSVGGVVSYQYDDLDRLTNKTTPQGSISYAYDDAGRLTSMTVAGQPAVNYTYDNGDRVTQVTQNGQTATIAYDDIGRRTSLTLPNNVVTEYAYDLGSHLTSLTYKHSGNVIGDLTYEYDAAGNVTRTGGNFARSVLPQPVTSATYNEANQQLTFGDKTLSYDLNGNLTSDGASTYTWNARNQLTQINGPDLNASFGYGGTASRTSTTIFGDATSFLRSGASVVQQQSAQSGTTNIVNGGRGEAFTRTNNSGVRSSLTDASGNLIALTDQLGSIKTEYSYGPFGESASSGEHSDNLTQFAGSENDGSGLLYDGNHNFSPELRRYPNERSGGGNQYAAGPKSFLRDPFSVDNWVPNGVSNTINDLMMGDYFSYWAWTWADPCRPVLERILAGGKIIGMAAVMAGGGVIVRGAGRLIGAGFRLIRPTEAAVAEVAAAEAAARGVAGEGNVVYRGLAEGEEIANGLTARAPNAGNSPMSHVAGKRASQWISTTKSEAIAIERYGQNGVVRIDLNQVTSPIVDLSGGFGGNATMLSRWAINSQEVLIQQCVPANAITRIH